jgi:ElaA protein
MTDWHLKTFNQLNTTELYELIKLRVDVFVVEQNCPYPELDNKDQLTDVYHLLGYNKNELVACARLLGKGITYPNIAIGRIITKQTHRGSGLGHQLIKSAIENCVKLWGDAPIEIGAQAHLEKYYAQHGFKVNSDSYLEDGIPHIDMIRYTTT